MTKVLRCNDLMPGCTFEARGSSEEEVLAQAAEHARSGHGLPQISEDMVMQVRGAIRDEEEGGAPEEEVMVVESPAPGHAARASAEGAMALGPDEADEDENPAWA